MARPFCKCHSLHQEIKVLLGFNSNSFVGQPWQEVLPKLASWGYQAVGLTPDQGFLDPRYIRPDELRQVGKICQQLGLKVVVETGARFLLDEERKHRPNLLEPDASHQIRLKFMRHMVEWCDLLGAEVLSFWSGALPEGQTEEGAELQFFRCMENLAGLAKRYGVTLALEPEPGHWVENLDDWARLQKLRPNLFELCLDIGHVLVTQECQPEEAVQDYLPHIVNLHLDDMNRGVHRHLPPGEGEMDWPKLAKALSHPDLAEVPACWELSRDSARFLEIAPRANEYLNLNAP